MEKQKNRKNVQMRLFSYVYYKQDVKRIYPLFRRAAELSISQKRCQFIDGDSSNVLLKVDFFKGVFQTFIQRNAL